MDGQKDTSGKPVPLAQQQQDRAYGIARVETLGRRRTDLVSALDAALPNIQIPIKDIHNSDPTLSCNAAGNGGQGSLHTELSNLLGRLDALYDDGTIPQTTESLGRVFNAFQSRERRAGRVRCRLRQSCGVPPREHGARGGAAPSSLLIRTSSRSRWNTALGLLSPDSQPYTLSATFDANGHRVAIPGASYGSSWSRCWLRPRPSLRTRRPDPPLKPLTSSADPVTQRAVLSRPRGDLELVRNIFYAQDPSFGAGNSEYIVARDPRGFAAVPLSSGMVPAPFVDADKDGLPDVNAVGQFTTTNGMPAPAPFFAVGAPAAPAVDASGRSLTAAGGSLFFSYVDTSHTYTATLMGHLQPMVDPNPADDHETLMNAARGGAGSSSGLAVPTRRRPMPMAPRSSTRPSTRHTRPFSTSRTR